MKNNHRIYAAHTINAVALSLITIYVPAYLLTLGYSFVHVTLFYVISHSSGLLIAFFIIPFLSSRLGLLNIFKLYYPFQIAYFLLLSLLKFHAIPIELIALLGGVANMFYWLPMNIFLIKHSASEEMGSSLSKFFSLPQIFSISGPLISAALIPIVGFWIIFALTIFLLFVTYIPLAGLSDAHVRFDFHMDTMVHRFWQNRLLFFFEFLDNIIEESEWFWSIYIFLVIGSLTTPGIVGSLEAVGSALFTLGIGKLSNKYAKVFIPLSSILLVGLTILQMIVVKPLGAYAVTVIISFVLTLFLVSYFSSVYKVVKNDREEEFMLIREVPVTFGRMVVFAGMLLFAPFLRYFFFIPLFVVILLLVLYFWKGRKLFAARSKRTLAV